MTTIPAVQSPRSGLRQRQVFGILGLALSFVPWLVLGGMWLLQPG